MSPSQIRAMLCVSRGVFARLVGVDLRTVHRWESLTRSTRPEGPAAQILEALAFVLQQQDVNATVAKQLNEDLRIGGLTYVLITLLRARALAGKDTGPGA